MKKNMYLSTLLITGVIALSSAQGAFAATTAFQTVTATHLAAKQVVTNGGNIAAVIAEADGALSAALNPGFRMTTNTAISQTLYVKAECNTTGGLVNALSGTGATGTTFISLTNQTTIPTPAAVTDAQAVAPTPAVNANVIAYSVDQPTLPAGLTYVNFNLDRWNMTLAKKGQTDTLISIPAAIPKTDTFSLEDVDGTYQAIITLSFV